MKKFDPIQIWLDNVAYSHSKSEDTERNYRSAMRDFCAFLECTPQEIIDDFERLTDREFRKKYSQLLKIYISKLSNQDYAVCTVKYKVTPVKSFFKYNDLPLGYIPIARRKVTYHNRDITKREIVAVINISNVRDQAFYTMMAQSGQRPFTLCLLRRKHIEPDFTKGIIPCEIKVPAELAKGEFGAYFTFMGEESVKRLRHYFRQRGVVGPEDYIFAKSGSDTQLNRKSVSFLFAKALEKLKAAEIISFEQKKPGKQRELRLYNLRKWFRNQAVTEKSGIEYVNFWMGHKADYKAPHIPASDAHYFSREDVEFQRKLYRDHAMPHLRLETATPDEGERERKELRKLLENRNREIEDLKASQKRTAKFMSMLLQAVSRRETVGNLYGLREKAWPKFLAKYYPDVKKPLHEIEGSLAKKIRDEFEQYWMKEYWEEES